MAEKPTTAFMLSLIRGMLILARAMMTLIGIAVFATVTGAIPMAREVASAIVMVYGLAALVVGISVIVSAIMINSGNPIRVRAWSIVVIVFSVTSMVFGGAS